MSFSRHVIGLIAVSVSVPSLAQTTGSLTYGPAAAGPGAAATPPTPVPIPSLFLLPLAIALAFFGYRALRKQGGRQLLGAVLLASGVSLGGISSLYIQDAIAQMMIELDQPQGGTVDIPASDAIYTNTSGVALQIGTVVPPPSCATSSPADECVTNLVLEDGESCSTVYDCLPVVTVTKTQDGEEGMTPINGQFTLTRTGDTTNALAVTYTLSGTATVVDDYTVASETTIEIPAASASVALDFAVVDDEIYDPNESVILTLSASADYTVGTEGFAEAAITARDKRLFVTDTTYNGNLGGVAGADAKCDADSNKPSDGSTYKAMLAGGGRDAAPTPTDWVLATDTRYFRPSGVFIAGTGSAVVFSFPLRASVDPPSLATDLVWTGLINDWTTSAYSCSGWVDASGFGGSQGDPYRSSTGAIDVITAAYCFAERELYCAEQ